MKTAFLEKKSLLMGYDNVVELYPFTPSLSHWRAWEFAAYQKFDLEGRILDLGCGDGRYFRLLWPKSTEVVGVDINPVAAEAGKASGVYKEVHITYAHQIPELDASFDHVFANCSLEHMDHLDQVLSEAQRCLKPGGSLLCSVVTHRFIDWAVLPNLVALAGFGEASNALKSSFLNHHHLANPFTPGEWVRSFEKAGLIAEHHIPILPKHNSGIFLLMDGLWHIQNAGGGEFGDFIYPFLANNPNFPNAFRKVFEGLLDMETDWEDCSGAVFLVRKPNE